MKIRDAARAGNTRRVRRVIVFSPVVMNFDFRQKDTLWQGASPEGGGDLGVLCPERRGRPLVDCAGWLYSDGVGQTQKQVPTGVTIRESKSNGNRRSPAGMTTKGQTNAATTAKANADSLRR